jgi:lipoprotein LprG
MQALQSAHFAISRGGGPVYLDADETLVFSAAQGDYAAPDAVSAEVTVAGPGVALAVYTIAVGPDQWITNPLSGAWEKLPPGWGFNPAILFDPQLGWQPLLNQDISNVELVGLVQEEEQSLYHIRAEATGERIQAVTGGLVRGDEPIEVEIWLDPATNRVHRLHFLTPSAAEEPAEWTLEFSQFNNPVNIQPVPG